eukprot:CAMPEP_0118911642 /NCGR_PEP_ID=MMETSP1166-20130328/13249_1 /TAXON_ID=1104430 /ORGANISM="Chrysoreinhardia sp, Strain CCMP3193" /LENGTH=103 /DNA_ID=CAMNT_0006851139 /DNA_START=170 /DNA_END=481 /DNA_ORIENTATION=-
MREVYVAWWWGCSSSPSSSKPRFSRVSRSRSFDSAGLATASATASSLESGCTRVAPSSSLTSGTTWATANDDAGIGVTTGGSVDGTLDSFAAQQEKRNMRTML